MPCVLSCCYNKEEYEKFREGQRIYGLKTMKRVAAVHPAGAKASWRREDLDAVESAGLPSRAEIGEWELPKSRGVGKESESRSSSRRRRHHHRTLSRQVGHQKTELARGILEGSSPGRKGNRHIGNTRLATALVADPKALLTTAQ